MAVALTVFEGEQTKYGLPARVVFDDELGTWLTVDAETTDYAEAALAAYREQHKTIPPGTVLQVKMAPGAPGSRESALKPPAEPTLGSGGGSAGIDADAPLG